MCVHDTDNKGFCVKNGLHCAFAHGTGDLRTAVYDIREIAAIENGETDLSGLTGPNSLDKERNLVNDDPKWQDTTYVLANYKTESCKKPPRLCRQGYACPQVLLPFSFLFRYSVLNRRPLVVYRIFPILTLLATRLRLILKWWLII